MVMANVQSLRNKIDELQATVHVHHAYREACILAFTETWLKSQDSDSVLTINGFGIPLRTDRDPVITGKSQGGGVCLYINERWCNSVIVRESLCTQDIELLSVSLRPFYLPREFPQIFVTVVYIHPKANEAKVKETVEHTVSKLQNVSPDAPNFVMGDFNHCSLKHTLRNFQQYVTCATRFNKTLDLCYGSVRGAYKSISNPPLGLSDHNAVLLIPVYKTVLKRYRAENKSIKKWSADSSLALQGCLECTNWEVFDNSCSDIDELTDVVSSYINFCEDILSLKKRYKHSLIQSHG